MRLRYLFQRRRLDDEVAAELAAHLEMLTDRYIAAGVDPVEARRQATRQLGNTALVREDVYQMNSVRWLDTLLQDLRLAFRGFARTPAFAAVVVATLALGIGANVAIFSVVHAVLIKPLPYAEPEQIYSAQIVIPERREQFGGIPATIQTFQDWRAASTVFSAMAALRPWEANVTGDGEPQRVGAARVSANFFDFLGIPVSLGRGFTADEETLGRDRVVVISDGLWRTRYGADPSIVGRTITINGESLTVVGVAAPSLLVPTGTRLQMLVAFAPRVDMWRPIAPTAAELKQESWDHGVLVRLPPGGNLAIGGQQLAALLNERLRRQMPDARLEGLLEFVPIREAFAGKVRLRLLLILAASSVLLLAACASIANVFLARVATRANEFATRVALGASRARILSQTLTEALLLAACGGAVAAILAVYGARLFAAFGPDDIRAMRTIEPNVSLLLFGLAVTLLTGIAAGVVPAWQSYRRESVQDLRASARAALGGHQATRSRSLLVALETALATVLLGASSLLLHSFVNVVASERGYDVERVLTADLSLFGRQYDSGEARAAFYNSVLDNVRGLPGVVSAGAISNLPAVAAWDGASRTILYDSDTNLQTVVLARPVAMIRGVTEGYFSASGNTLRAGRFLTDQESQLAGVISESLANQLWPGQPLGAIVGRSIKQGSHQSPLITIVGIAGNEKPAGLEREPPAVVYRPYRQWASGPMTLVVRTAQEPGRLAAAIRTEIRSKDPNLPILDVRTMKDIVSSAVADRRFQMLLTSIFGVVALLLGIVGVYGVVSYNVACRTRDIGLRIALGAARLDIARWVFSGGMKPVTAGLIAGLAATVGVAASVRSLLFGIAPTDPVALAAVTATLLLTSGLACYLPARRAASLDPIVALRQE